MYKTGLNCEELFPIELSVIFFYLCFSVQNAK